MKQVENIESEKNNKNKFYIKVKKILKCLKIKFKKIYKWFRKKFRKIKGYFNNKIKKLFGVVETEANYIKMSLCSKKDYNSFSPKNNISYKNENIKMLLNALKDRNNRNIAISGKYGAGKSSIIKSFFKSSYNKLIYKPLYVSLGMFEIDENIDDVNKFSQQIEKSIIQQILYSEKTVNLPDSNINRTTKLRSKHIKNILTTIFSICIIILFKLNNFNFTDLFNYINNIVKNIIFYFEPQNLKITYNFIKEMPFSNFFTAIILSWTIISIIKFFANIYRRFKIKGIKIGAKDTVIELSKNEGESLINKYLDELVYFFSKTKYKTIIIEDLDRFIVDKNIKPKENDASKCTVTIDGKEHTFNCKNQKFIDKYNQKILIIFQKLKELNEILNNSKEINQEIKFLYAVKDDIFNKSLERTKFFDFIIPVIPILGTYNSYAQLEEKINNIETNLKIRRKDKIDKNLIKDLSDYIDDYRLMTSILNEYTFYIRNIDRDNLDKNRLFAMIVLKNINPKEYDDLMNNTGRIYDLLNSSDAIIKRATNRKQEKININNENIKQMKLEILNNFKELKSMLLGKLAQKEITSYSSNGLSAEEFLDDDITIDYIENNTINIYFYNGRNCLYNEKTVFNDDKQGFIKRARIIESKDNREIELLKKENISLKKEIDNFKRKKISELLEYDKEYVTEQKINLNSLEYKLLARDYIDQNYQAYMYKFKSTTKHTIEDETFIYNNRHYHSMPINYKLVNPQEVVDELELKFFGIKNILNFSLTEFLLNNEEEKFKLKKEEFIKLLTGNIDTDNSLQIINYIYSYINEMEAQEKNKLIYELHNYDEKIILKILRTFIDTDEHKYDSLIKRLMNCPSILKDELIQKEVHDYILQLNDFETWIELNDNVKESLKILKVKFELLEEQKEKELIEYIYSNNLYICNSNMIKLIFEHLGYQHKLFNTMNFSLIMKDEKLNMLKNYILSNKAQYIEQCYLKTNNIETDVEDINNIVNTWDIDDNLKEEIIRKMSAKVLDLSAISKTQYYDCYLKNNKIEVSWENIYRYYEAKESEITEVLIDFIEKNIEDIIKIDITQINRTQEFLKMCAKIAKNNTIKLEVYKKLVPELKVIIGTINTDEIDKERLKILVSNKMLAFNTNNFSVIAKELIELLDFYIVSHIENFIETIDDYELDDEIINVILKSDKIRFKYKTKLIETIDIDLLNEDSLEYIVNNYNRTKIAKIKNEIKEKILSSEIAIIYKVKFLNIELDLETSYEKIKKYLKLMGEPHNLIGDYQLKNTTFSIPKYDESLEFVKKLKQKGFLFTYKEHRETITINNKKQVL